MKINFFSASSGGDKASAETTRLLKDSEERLRILFEYAPDAYYINDLKGNIIDGNRAAEELTGYSRHELIGKNFLNIGLLPLNQVLKATVRLAKNATGQPTGPDEFTLTRKNRSRVDVEIRTYPVKLGGQTCVLGIARDITERKRAHEESSYLQQQLQQSQKMEAIGTLAGGLAHDLNNMLTVIMGNASMIKLRSGPEDANHLSANMIEEVSQQAADLIEKLIGFAKKGKYHNIRVDIHSVIASTVSMLSRTIDRNIEIRQELHARHYDVSGDPNQLQQVMMNLAINARDAMPKGGTLTFHTSNHTISGSNRQSASNLPPGTYLSIKTIDTGSGISANIQQQIFEPFFTTKGVGKGSGLGLSLVHGITNNHGGTVSISSKVGKGATFEVLLPIHVAEAKAPADGAAAIPDRHGVPARGKILVVDDDTALRTTIGSVLASQGYSIAYAKDGRQAIEVFRKSKPTIDLVILDMIMPVMDGRECFYALREIDSSVKVILSTGHANDKRIQELADAGIAKMIPKPYSTEELLKAVADVLAQKN